MHVSAFLVAATGLVYAWMRYIAATPDEFALVNHPLQPTVQHLHVLTAPALVIMLGVFWQSHAMNHWKHSAREGRYSGIGQLLVALPMILSAYLLQTATSEGWRLTWIWVHVATSVAWVAGYLIHYGTHLVGKRKGQAEISSSKTPFVS